MPFFDYRTMIFLPLYRKISCLRKWNSSGILCRLRKENSRRKVDYEIYKSIVYNLEVRKVFLDPKLSLVKFSSIVGTNTTYLSNVVNHYFKCNFKHLLNKYRILHAKHLIDNNECAITELDKRCGFTSRSVFYDAFGKIMGIPPAHYRKRREKAAETCSGLSGTMENSLGKNEIRQQQVI